MEYYVNEMDEAVIRVTPEGDRYVKFCGQREFLAQADSKVAYGGVSFGVYHMLTEITKKQYDGFGTRWKFGRMSEIVVNDLYASDWK